MRKIFWLFMMLLLAACGGGGGTGANTPAGKGSLSLEVVKAASPAAKTLALTTASPGRVRIVVTETTTGYRDSVDQALGDTTATFSLPTGTYKLEAVFYEKGYPNVVTDYGVATGVAVGTGANTAALTVDSVTVTLPVPTVDVYSGGSYSVAAVPAATLSAMGLQDKWSLASSTSAFSGRKHLAQAPSATHLTMTAPTGYGTMYLQGEFFMKANLLNSNEAATDFAVFAEGSVPLKAASLPVDVAALGISDTQKPVVKSFTVPTDKQTVAAVSGISILASDNGGIKQYAITTTPDVPALDSPAWSSTPSFVYAGTVDGNDTTVDVYAWAKDFSDNISLPFAKKQIVFNDSPVVTAFGVPSSVVLDGTQIPFTVVGKGSGNLFCTIAETATLPATPVWHAMSVATATTPATFTGVYSAATAQTPGVKMSVPLYAWVKDTAGKISPYAARTAIVNDIPQVTAFTATAAATGTTVTFTMDAAVASGRTFAGYALTTTNTAPAAADYTLGAKPTPTTLLTYNYAGITSFPTTRALYLWVKDDAGYVSLGQGTLVTFKAP